MVSTTVRHGSKVRYTVQRAIITAYSVETMGEGRDGQWILKSNGEIVSFWRTMIIEMRSSKGTSNMNEICVEMGEGD